MSTDRCQRCLEVGEDRRTLWMAASYAMEEFDIPFDPVILLEGRTEDLEISKDPTTIEVGEEKKKIVLESGLVRSKGELRPMRLYTLRVCKDCRADWMKVIEDWYAAGPKRESTGTGIWIRERGSVREATPEEVERMKRERDQHP